MTKVVLAYSGSLDTTICVHWLKNVKGFRVYTFSANLGQVEDLQPLAEKAVELGASAAHLADLRDKFATDFIAPCIRANAVYEGGYFLFSALSRPLIVQELVAIAREEGCDTIAHGSRGIGNDSLRFERCIKALAPDLNILSPLQELALHTPEDDVGYAKEHRLKVENMRKTLYNMEQNLWGANIQVRQLKNTWDEPSADTYVLTTPPSEAPSKITTITLEFEKGVPVGLNGDALPAVKLIERLNSIGGRNAVGRYDVVESRMTGYKTREIYESPAAAIFRVAHRALESITLDKDVLHFQDTLSSRFADLVYEGKWFSPFREGLDRFFQSTQESVTGRVRLNLCKGMIQVTGRESDQTLYEAREHTSILKLSGSSGV